MTIYANTDKAAQVIEAIPEGLVAGFVRSTGNMEFQYAVKRNGSILFIQTRAPNPHFGREPGKNGKLGDWCNIDAIPDSAEFIGNYPDVGIYQR